MSEFALEPWLTKHGVAAHLSCSTRQIDRWVLEGMPHAVFAGARKFKISEAETWLEQTGRLERRGASVSGTDERRAAA